MDLKDTFGPNPLETIIQATSAIATAAAAIFAALSARSAAESAKEMERARELSNAPVITITPNTKEIGYIFDLINGLDGKYPHNNQFCIENHGNGPALNLNINYKIELSEPSISEHIVIVSCGGSSAKKCFATPEGLLWEPHQTYERKNTLKREGNEFVVSLAKSEKEQISIPEGLMDCWMLDAASFNASEKRASNHVSRLIITVTFDTVLKKAQQQTFHFLITSTEFPKLGIERDMWGGSFSYNATIEPTMNA